MGFKPCNLHLNAVSPQYVMLLSAMETRATRLPVFWSRQRSQTTFHGRVGRGDKACEENPADTRSAFVLRQV